MARLIDYAGLFPPARLPLRESLENYLRYKVENDSWMLGRFICPASRLAEVAKLRDQVFSAGPPIEFAALGQGGATPAEFRSNLESDLAAARNFVTAMDGRALVDVFEVRLPEAFVHGASVDELSRALLGVEDAIKNLWPGELAVFFEAPPASTWKDAYHTLISALSRNRETHDAFRAPVRESAGLKLRCGGEQASAVPSAELTAMVVGECARRGVRFKATAGLHHPIRRFDRNLRGPMHGFLNLFGAGILARATALHAERIPEMLADEDPDNFHFGEDFFQWKDCKAETVLVTRARKDAFISFGSCSFDEPREDLRRLGLLEEAIDLA